MKRRATSRGIALPMVLLLAAMMLVTASAWLQTSLVAARTTLAARERAQAFHAADSALIRCARLLASALPASGAIDQEPSLWRSKSSFEGASMLALQPFAAWPYARRAPQCLIETFARAKGTSYLVTARGFGLTAETEAWLQLRIDVAEDGITKNWRRVVAKPF
jgi:Tfp pilus assembly protein PilX